MQVSLAAYPLLLIGILGTSIAPLCGVSSGWAYYHTDHLHTISGYRSESTWVIYAPLLQHASLERFDPKMAPMTVSCHAWAIVDGRSQLLRIMRLYSPHRETCRIPTVTAMRALATAMRGCSVS